MVSVNSCSLLQSCFVCRRDWSIWLNNHGKVPTIFNEAQAQISKDRNSGHIYLVANLTRWTAHYIAFARLCVIKEALQLAVMLHREAIIAAEVGAAKAAEKDRLTNDAHYAELRVDQYPCLESGLVWRWWLATLS